MSFFLIKYHMFAEVVELADAQASGACGSNTVWVQVPSPAFFICILKKKAKDGNAPSTRLTE